MSPRRTARRRAAAAAAPGIESNRIAELVASLAIVEAARAGGTRATALTALLAAAIAVARGTMPKPHKHAADIALCRDFLDTFDEIAGILDAADDMGRPGGTA